MLASVDGRRGERKQDPPTRRQARRHGRRDTVVRPIRWRTAGRDVRPYRSQRPPEV